MLRRRRIPKRRIKVREEIWKKDVRNELPRTMSRKIQTAKRVTKERRWRSILLTWSYFLWTSYEETNFVMVVWTVLAGTEMIMSSAIRVFK